LALPDGVLPGETATNCAVGLDPVISISIGLRLSSVEQTACPAGSNAVQSPQLWLTGLRNIPRNNGACFSTAGETMNKILKSSVMVLGLVLLMAAPAYAHGRHGGGGSAPEVDPSLAIAGISFLAGSLVVLRSRLRK